MNIRGLKAEELEMLDGLSHYDVVHAYPSGANTLLVIQNKLNKQYSTETVTEGGCQWSIFGVSRKPIVAPKKRKKTYIKTLKELVDSGWDATAAGDLYHPDSAAYISPGMFQYLGQELCHQPGWSWTPQMLTQREE